MEKEQGREEEGKGESWGRRSGPEGKKQPKKHGDPHLTGYMVGITWNLADTVSQGAQTFQAFPSGRNGHPRPGHRKQVSKKGICSLDEGKEYGMAGTREKITNWNHSNLDSALLKGP